MITKRDFILCGSYLCEKYCSHFLEGSDIEIYDLLVIPFKETKIYVIAYPLMTILVVVPFRVTAKSLYVNYRSYTVLSYQHKLMAVQLKKGTAQ